MARLGRGRPIRSFFTRRSTQQSATPSFLLLQNGSKVLLEDSTSLLAEGAPTAVARLSFGQPGEAADFLGVGHVEAAVTITVLIRFRQSGVWVAKPMATRASGAWATKSVSVRKAGSWSSV